MSSVERLPLVVALAAALPAAFALNPSVDPDTWWHLRVGQLVWDTGSVPDTDPFSRFGREQLAPWVAYSWLFDLGLYGAYSAGSLTGVMVARSILCAVSSAAVLGFVARRGGIIAAGLAAVVLMPFARERPWHLTMVFTVLTVDAVQRLRAGEQTRALWLPAVFVVWANLHIQFVLGWLVLGLVCVFPGEADRRKLAGLTITCVLATVVNPYHVRLLGVVWNYATQTGPLRNVQELAPPEVGSLWTWAAMGLVGWAVVAVARRRPVDWFTVSVLVVGVVLSLRMRRDLWFGAVAAAACLGTPASLGCASRLTAAIVGTYLAVRLIPYAGVGTATDFAAVVGKQYPEHAVEVIRTRQLPGPMFNPFDWGGYLIWALPDHPVSIDGRTNLYGSERISRSMATWAGELGWDADPDLVSANLVVAPVRGPLADRLRGRKTEWAAASEDATAVVFLRLSSPMK